MEKGMITLAQFIGWGIAIASTATGIFWTKVSTTDSRVNALKDEQMSVVERVATVEESIRTLKEITKETRDDVKLILLKLK